MTNYLRVSVPPAFSEYDAVLKHTEDLERLKRLAGLAVHKSQVPTLVAELSKAVGIATPQVVDIRRVKGGQSSYHPRHEGGPTLRLARFPDLHTICHELAHHWHWYSCRVKGRGKYRAPFHGFDFTWRLDELARLAEEIVNRPLDMNQVRLSTQERLRNLGAELTEMGLLDESR